MGSELLRKKSQRVWSAGAMYGSGSQLPAMPRAEEMAEIRCESNYQLSTLSM